MKDLSYIDKNRISNIVWTMTEKYGYEVDFTLINEDYFDYDIIYNAVIIGSIYNILDYQMILDFVNNTKAKINKNTEILNIFFMCIESTCITRNTELIKNIDNIRGANYRQNINYISKSKDKDRLFNILKLAYYEKFLGKILKYPPDIKNIINAVYEFENIDNTLDFIDKFIKVIGDFFKFEEDGVTENSKSDTLSHKDLQKIGELKNNTQTIQEFFDNYTSSEFNPNESIIEKNFSTDSSTIDDQREDENKQNGFAKMEQYYGKRLYSKGQTEILEKKFCQGIHTGYKLFFTDGDIGIIKKEYRKEQIRLEQRRNEQEYKANKSRYDNSVEKIKALIRQSMKFEEKQLIESFSGNIEANKIYRAEKINDYKIFAKEKRRDEVKFLVDIVIDSSASLLDKQDKISVQAYVISRALQELGIDNNVKTFNSFMDYTIIKILKKYDDDNVEKCFEYFCSGGNRDGLAIDVIGGLNDHPQDCNRLMIVFTDARPFDVQIIHAIGTKAKKPYQGSIAIDDTAGIVRKLRQKNTRLCTVFSGADEDIKVLRYMYGSDFLHIKDIEQFSTKVGRFISDYIFSFYE